MRLILDSSIFIDALRQKAPAKRYLRELEYFEHELFISSITAYEIFSGATSKDLSEQKKIKAYVKYFQVVDLTWEISRLAGEVYRDTKLQVETADFIIAASAIKIGAEVATLNDRHFRLIPNIKLYKHE
jgi:predicted nucleic acid-binding protein